MPKYKFGFEHLHWNSVWFITSTHVALFRHGLLEHGLESLWHAPPVLYWLHSQMYCCNELSLQMPWFEQFDKHADKSPVYFSRISFNWLPALFGLNIDEALILNDVVVAVVVVVEFMWIFKFFDF